MSMALAIDIADLKPHDLTGAKSGAIGNGEGRAGT